MSEDLNVAGAEEAPATGEDINKWFSLVEKIAPLKEEEERLRRLIAKTFFPTPKEGVNTLPLTDGWVMKMEYRVNRNLDEGEYTARREELRAAAIPDEIVIEKPSFVLGVYRDLTVEQKKIFDQCLKSNPGLPGLKIEKPKRPKK